MNTLTITIPLCNKGTLLNKLEHFTKKSTRLNSGFASAWFGVEGTTKFPLVDQSETPHTVKYLDLPSVECVLTFAPLKIEGFIPVAQLEHLPAGNLVKVFDHKTVVSESWRKAKNSCHHCKAKRNRDITYLLLASDGTMFQVGSTCIKDFTGIDPSEFLFRLECLAEIKVFEDDFLERGLTHFEYLENYLPYVAMSARLFGWVSKKQSVTTGSEPTSETAFSMQCDNKKTEDIDKEVAKKAIIWASALQPKNDFESNIKILAQSAIVKDRNRGFAASIVGSYILSLEREKTAHLAATSSAHLGVLGSKISVECTIISVHSFDSVIMVGYKEIICRKHLYLFKTAEGYILKWNTTSDCSEVVGNKVLLSGKVKAHTEFRGVKQTDLTRCKMALVKNEA